jgi:steroid 5-alpha reductase family enzyme
MRVVLAINLVLLFGFMSLMFLVARRRQRLDTVDVAWGLGFVMVAWTAALYSPTTRSLVVALLVSVWGLRLASHIHRRSKLRGDDPRYQELSAKWSEKFGWHSYVWVFLLQGGLIWMISVPVAMLANPELPGREWLTWLGGVVWLAGFVFEAVADRQLRLFQQQKNHPSVLQTGLWRYSRHPNYFCELVQWWGIGIISLQVSYGWLGLVGPIILSYLMIFVSGIPPIEKRRQKNSEYQKYKQRTSPLIPLPPRA